MAQRGGCVTSHVRYGRKSIRRWLNQEVSRRLSLLKNGKHCAI